ncbi:MAG: hypothetical protein K1X57_14030 [Gemmataceae bacterium]|nr:hypothetical protein [Gemmataceae bacterium]
MNLAIEVHPMTQILRALTVTAAMSSMMMAAIGCGDSKPAGSDKMSGDKMSNKMTDKMGDKMSDKMTDKMGSKG